MLLGWNNWPSFFSREIWLITLDTPKEQPSTTDSANYEKLLKEVGKKQKKNEHLQKL